MSKLSISEIVVAFLVLLPLPMKSLSQIDCLPANTLKNSFGPILLASPVKIKSEFCGLVNEKYGQCVSNSETKTAVNNAIKAFIGKLFYSQINSHIIPMCKYFETKEIYI